MNPETLPQQEFEHEEIGREALPGRLNPHMTASIMQERVFALNRLRPLLSKKIFYQLEEKLEKEKKLFENLLSWQRDRKQKRQLYSLVLDPAYFEQKLM